VHDLRVVLCHYICKCILINNISYRVSMYVMSCVHLKFKFPGSGRSLVIAIRPED
jgi:hypothetical protein